MIIMSVAATIHRECERIAESWAARTFLEMGFSFLMGPQQGHAAHHPHDIQFAAVPAISGQPLANFVRRAIGEVGRTAILAVHSTAFAIVTFLRQR